MRDRFQEEHTGEDLAKALKTLREQKQRTV
jgi:hypothetical protein